ncbi:hypothetical protein VNI00_005224 [Paramarasmius palmivorus]|uniref:Uncharacterized protein n=1 Tax=Paramarasmius palmivorus TaxID=297713 RepID=A0AAW0DIG6_9AGAR
MPSSSGNVKRYRVADTAAVTSSRSTGRQVKGAVVDLAAGSRKLVDGSGSGGPSVSAGKSSSSGPSVFSDAVRIPDEDTDGSGSDEGADLTHTASAVVPLLESDRIHPDLETLYQSMEWINGCVLPDSLFYVSLLDVQLEEVEVRWLREQRVCFRWLCGRLLRAS